VDRKHLRLAEICSLTLLFAALVTAGPHPRRTETSGAVYEKEIRRRSDALDSIKTEIDARRKKLHELEAAEGNYLARLDNLESNIAASKKYLALLSNRIDTAETTIVKLTDSLHEAEELLTDRQAIMKRRLRGAYKSGAGATPIMVLLLSKNPLDAIHRVRYLEEVYRYDRELVDKIKITRTTIADRKTARERERATLARLLTDKKKENDMQVREESSRRLILSDIRSKKKTNIAVIDELEAAQAELNKIIRRLERKRKQHAEAAPLTHPSIVTGAFGKLQGSLPWPLNGAVLARYGKIVHPIYQTITMNNGIDIQTKEDDQVRCVANGTVLHTGSMRGLGKLVIVDHGNDLITIYAHLAEIGVATDQKVLAGTIIGRAGAGGGSETPLLHFEIRKSTESLDPEKWLEKKK
jgi:murein hydrolase activator